MPPTLNVTGKRLLSATGGTTTLNWYNPTKPGARPAKLVAAGVWPNKNCTGKIRVSFAGAIFPAAHGGFTRPNPMPYIMIVSPGLPGRDATPEIAPEGRS